MKLTLVLSLFALYTVHSMPTGEDGPATHEHVHKAGPYQTIRTASAALAPAGRGFGSGDSASSVQCAGTCARQMQANMQRELPGYDQQQAANGEFDPEKLNKVCSVHDTTKTCLDSCQSSQVKAMFGKALGMLQYMCHDSNFKQNAPCLNEVMKSTNATCSAPSKCGQYTAKVDEYKRNSPTDENGLKDMLKQTCLGLKCTLDCAKPKVIEKCGQSAQNDLQGLSGKGVEFLKFTVETLGIGSAYPRECDRVAAA